MFNYAGRLFTFGCSFTKYSWPTWADILGTKFVEHNNWGMPGAGNQYIFNSLVECSKRNQFKAGDTVIIMWTTVSRYDYYANGKWQALGEVLLNQTFPKKFTETFFDFRGYLIRDLAVMSAAKSLLESCGVEYHFLSMTPFDHIVTEEHNGIFDYVKLKSEDVFALYQEELDIIKPSIFDTVFSGNWSNRNHLTNTKQRPDSKEVTRLINLKTESMISNEYNFLAGFDWPPQQDILKKSYTKSNVETELESFRLRANEIINQVNTSAKINLKIYKLGREDLHPTPKHYLDYLLHLFPELTFDDEILNWVEEFDKNVVSLYLFSGWEMNWHKNDYQLIRL